MICFSVFLIGAGTSYAQQCARNGIGDASCLAPATTSVRPVARPPGVGVRPVARPITLPGTTAPLTSPLPRPRPSHLGPTPNPHPPAAPTIDTTSVPAKNIAEAAYATLGFSTVASDTDGGKKGCAVGVSKILENAGYPIGRITGTWTLLEKLEADDCYETLLKGKDLDFSLQPGDVLVTPSGSKGAGHTGVYVGDGSIISNTSYGFNGSEPGTVQKNYTVGEWNEKVIPRRKGNSAVYRRKESCG